MEAEIGRGLKRGELEQKDKQSEMEVVQSMAYAPKRSTGLKSSKSFTEGRGSVGGGVIRTGQRAGQRTGTSIQATENIRCQIHPNKPPQVHHRYRGNRLMHNRRRYSVWHTNTSYI